MHLARRIEAARGHAAAATFVRKWEPALSKGLEWLANKTQPGSGSSLPWNDPDQPLVGCQCSSSLLLSASLCLAPVRLGGRPDKMPLHVQTGSRTRWRRPVN